MKKKILITRKLLKENEDKLQELFDVKLNIKDEIYTEDKILELSEDCDGILSAITDQFNKNLINKLSSSIKIIARRAAERQDWKWSADFMLGKQMSNRRLGILGMGRIGRAVAKRARGFNMEIHYHNRNQLSKDLEAGAIYHKTIKDLFNCSDFLSINCPATKETNKIINKETLAFLPDNVVIGNAARGDVVDDVAMIEALKSKKVFAFGLDVYNGEPKINAEYLKLDNIFLLPHLGSATKRTRWDMAYRATQNLEDFFSKGMAKDKVN